MADAGLLPPMINGIWRRAGQPIRESSLEICSSEEYAVDIFVATNVLYCESFRLETIVCHFLVGAVYSDNFCLQHWWERFSPSGFHDLINIRVGNCLVCNCSTVGEKGRVWVIPIAYF
jgi:hypothetical protein